VSGILPAGRAAVPGVAALLARAFAPLDVAAWLVPDPAWRESVLRAEFELAVIAAVEHGKVWRLCDGTGAAVWFSRSGPSTMDVDDSPARRAAVGPYLPRFLELDRQFKARHPTDPPHHHLALLGVAPEQQGRGIGGRLLEHHHLRLDRAGLPSFLEASCERSRSLYLRHGYVDLTPPIELPDGPRMWPMWRLPR
jgi:GNAT superfamily N-acetyltransferase